MDVVLGEGQGEWRESVEGLVMWCCGTVIFLPRQLLWFLFPYIFSPHIFSHLMMHKQTIGGSKVC